VESNYLVMDKERLKLIVRNLELLVDSLKAEVLSDVDAYKYDDKISSIPEYEEIFEDDDEQGL
jgi:hypothetical protein